MPDQRATLRSRTRVLDGVPAILSDPVTWYWAALILSACFFLNSLWAAGPVWDETEEFGKLVAQLSFAAKVLSGQSSLTFRALPGDSAYYGLGATLVPYLLSYVIDVAWLKRPVLTYEHSYSILLHSITFLCAIAAVVYTRRLVVLVTGSREAGTFAALLLLLTPFWIGYGFFDYKDIPVAAGVIAATYYAVAYWDDGRSQTSLKFFLALAFLGVQKFAVVPLALPACIVVLLVALRRPSIRRFTILALQAAACLLLLYLSTPPAWTAPVEFTVASLTYSSQHKWGGCTLTAGQCIGREVANGDGYSVLKYLGLWYGVKWPLLTWAGLVSSTGLYLWSFRRLRVGQHLLVAALCWPVAAMAGRDSTLYDDVRHVLFLTPLAVAMIFVMIPAGVWLRLRWWLAFYLLFLVIDSFKLQPFQYVWFNEAGRFFASERNFETDYWGYSLREAVAMARSRQGPADWIVSPIGLNPSHLVQIFATERFARRAEAVPSGASYLLVRITRSNKQAPEQCAEVQYVTRQELLAPNPLRLSLIAKCEGVVREREPAR